MNTETTFKTFTTWGDLLDAISSGRTMYYQAPLDYRPAVIQIALRKDGKIRVYPVYSDADPFTADAAHLSRFRVVDHNAQYNTK